MAGVEELFDLPRQAVGLVDEEDVSLLEAGEDPHEVGRPGEGGSRGADQPGAHFFGDGVGEGGFSEAGGAMEEDVADRLPPLLGRFNGDAQPRDEIGLPDVVREAAGAEAGDGMLLLRIGRSGGYAPFPDHAFSFTCRAGRLRSGWLRSRSLRRARRGRVR